MSEKMIPDDILLRLWKSRNTMLEILSDRKFEIDEEDFVDFETFLGWIEEDDSLEDVKNKIKLEVQKEEIKKSITNIVKAMVIWPAGKKLGGTNLREIVDKIEEPQSTQIIIVVDDSVTNWCGNFIKKLRTDKIYIDIYTFIESQYNITKNRLVPSHILCTPKEKKAVLKLYATDSKSIPQIKTTDPVVRHFGGRKGQLFKIIRQSDTQPGYTCVTYRIIV
jgi:DNA-directed RNA polymerase I, II, and III subunit RPABC1